MLSSKESLAVLKRNNALLEGHFVLSSGFHSSKYIQCAKLLSFLIKLIKSVFHLVIKLRKNSKK